MLGQLGQPRRPSGPAPFSRARLRELRTGHITHLTDYLLSASRSDKLNKIVRRRCFPRLVGIESENPRIGILAFVHCANPAITPSIDTTLMPAFVVRSKLEYPIPSGSFATA